ncbi:amidohydrolase family protein [Aquipuribacter sp. SD81]|uniref:amidohydrolase family protein n=1 Tax=Aquipuribacter sp. SD81 TaxID=3127703 RepID=UPI0030198877
MRERLPDDDVGPAARDAADTWRGLAVDAHHHLWDPADPGQDWLREPGLEVLRRPYTPDDLREAARTGVAGRPLAAGVVVQSVPTLAETVALLTTAAGDPTVAAVVGWVDLTGDVPGQLERLRGGAGGGLLRGVRHLVQDEPDPRWLLRDDVLAGLGVLVAEGLAFDVVVRSHQLPAVAEVAGAVPGLRLVLDHAGNPEVPVDAPARDHLTAWERDVRAVAARPGTVCKVSGLVTKIDTHRSPEPLEAVWTVLLDAFGPDRLAWGSDWPVCLLARPYAEWAALAAGLVEPLPAAGRHAVLAGTAVRTYDLPDPSPATDDPEDP